ncbi:hypothetical protein NC652_002312 [Populus alba x Populus x berolinensis]|uniref:Uncharacterized protein n=1 Tax=Populus alba x Populus x berolinensis TaxID=444605 RepID=A0AAD6WHT0_9ROSI|nr:hypothetical protein NC651_002229 [Populus alba x Populus x berolinensis]KAJ6963991.1 hypothetical protein NC652_002312 [Populus alba x Populus x berolinensis]KAJ7012306.1 hypothetical protein NC653_002382 [Populus alba x Populus x berolinensis]
MDFEDVWLLWTRFLRWLGHEWPFPRTVDDLLRLRSSCVHRKMQRRVWVLFSLVNVAGKE